MVAASVRIYQHEWPGDHVAGPPSSWLQDIRLVWASVGWQIDNLGPMHDSRSEPDEPHEPHTSACTVGRRPAVWLTTVAQFPATGGMPAFGVLTLLSFRLVP